MNKHVESLESRQMLAAHVLGSPTSFATIQAAVNAAPAGGIVRVDPGTYSELVTINKPLTLRGAQAGIDARFGSHGPASVVNGQDFGTGNRSTAFYITANDVTIDGFSVQDTSNSNVYGAGIVIAPLVSGTHVIDNVIQHNVAGLYLANASTVDPAVIQHNLFAYNNNPGNNNGRGIYTDGGVSGGNLTNVLIDGNTFVGNVGDGTSGNPEAAIGLEAQTAGKQSNITITNNIMSGNGKGVLMYNVDHALLQNNLMTGCTDTTSAALRIEGNVTNLAVRGNIFWANHGAAIRISDRFVGPSSNITINQNDFFNNAGGGLILDSSSYTGTLDARFNWWGSFSGPAGDGHGTGDSLITNGNSVLFTPFSRLPLL